MQHAGGHENSMKPPSAEGSGESPHISNASAALWIATGRTCRTAELRL
jgi:hypothetical protein